MILLSTGDPAANTTAPAGNLAGSGWQFEGDWGGLLGTPIAPHFFLSAAHIGKQGSLFNYGGNSYTIVRSYGIPDTDLLVWQVVETFPSFAPLYTAHDELGKSFVVIGRGTQRGSAVMFNGELRGWSWGNGDSVRRWGQNTVALIFSYQSDHNDLLYATFDEPGEANESQLSSGDSGGAVFINDNGAWKLAGINFAVDGPLYTDANGGGQFNAALFDARGFFTQNGSAYEEITGAAPVPTGMYVTRISSQIAAIYSITDPFGDPDDDGIFNLLEYALRLDPLTPDVNALPTIERSADTVSLTYRKSNAASDLTFTVEQSTDLVNWAPAQTQDTVLSNSDDVKVVKATVTGVSGDHLFLRLRVTRQ